MEIDGTLVLLGDSILDNAPYTGPEPDTAAHLAAPARPGLDELVGIADTFARHYEEAARAVAERRLFTS